MGSVDRLRITDDEEQQTLAPAPGLIGVSDLEREWERQEPSSANGIRRERSGADVFVVSLAGEHDLYTAPKVQDALRGAIARARTTVVDLTETTFLDSTLLHVLLVARNELRDGGRLLLVTDDPNIKRVFEVSGTDRLFDFYPSRRAAEQEARSR